MGSNKPNDENGRGDLYFLGLYDGLFKYDDIDSESEMLQRMSELVGRYEKAKSGEWEFPREKPVMKFDSSGFTLSTTSLGTTGMYDDLTDVSGVGPRKAEKLHGVGYKRKRDLQHATQSELADVDGISNALAARIKADVGSAKSAEELLEKINGLLEQYNELEG